MNSSKQRWRKLKSIIKGIIKLYTVMLIMIIILYLQVDMQARNHEVKYTMNLFFQSLIILAIESKGRQHLRKEVCDLRYVLVHILSIFSECKIQLLKNQALDAMSDKRRSLRLSIGDSINITQLQKEVSHFSDTYYCNHTVLCSFKRLRVS